MGHDLMRAASVWKGFCAEAFEKTMPRRFWYATEYMADVVGSEV